MKKIFFLLAGVFTFFACDPTHEDIGNDGHISLDDLIAKTSVTVDQDANGMNGNVITCTTSAPVTTAWTYYDQVWNDSLQKYEWDMKGGKTLIGNFSSKKMKVGEHLVRLTAYCADGTVLSNDYTLKCDVITKELKKNYLYGDPVAHPEQRPFKPAAWDAAAMRFSDNEGKFTDIDGKEGCFLPYIDDNVYKNKKTLIFDITDCTPDANLKIMTGWWSPVFEEDYPLYEKLGGPSGLWELTITDDIFKACARGEGGDGRDLDLMFKSGGCQINAVYWEE
jgi:hypothetical protein